MLSKLFFLFFSVQLYLTIFGGFFWPFSSHRLFSQLPERAKFIVQVRLFENNGTSHLVHPGKVLPIEYARTSGLIRDIYNHGTSEQKEHLYKYMLWRINQEPWFTFDEMFPMVYNSNWTSLVIEEHLVEFDGNSSHDLEVRQIYPGEEKFTRTNSKKNFTILNCLYFGLVILLTEIFSFQNWLFSGTNNYLLLRQSLCLTVIILLIFGPYSDFYTQNEPLFTGYFYLGDYFPYLKYLICFLAYLLSSNICPKITNPLLVIFFNYFQYYTTCFSTTYWITNTHLNIFLTLTCLPLFLGDRYKSFVQRFCQIYIMIMYFQAGLSKLLEGGISWFLFGREFEPKQFYLEPHLDAFSLNGLFSLCQWDCLVVYLNFF